MVLAGCHRLADAGPRRPRSASPTTAYIPPPWRVRGLSGEVLRSLDGRAARNGLWVSRSLRSRGGLGNVSSASGRDARPFRARCWRLASQDPGGQTLTPFGPIAARPWPARNRLPGFHARSRPARSRKWNRTARVADRLPAGQTLRLGPPHERGSVTPLLPPATVPHPHQHAADAPSPGGDRTYIGILSDIRQRKF